MLEGYAEPITANRAISSRAGGKPILSMLQATRFFAAAIVVLDHATIIFHDEHYFGVDILGGIFGSGRYGVDFFFVLSGFIICHAHWDDLAAAVAVRPQRLIRFAQRRFLRIYPTYWVALLLTLIPLYFTPSPFYDSIKSPWYLLNVVTLAQGNGNALTAAWTLTHEVAFYILFGIAIWWRNLGFVLMAAWFVISALSYTIPILDVIPSTVVCHPEHMGFLAGMAGCYLLKTALVPAPKLLFALGLGGFIACCMFVGFFRSPAEINAVLSNPLSRGPLLPLAFCSLLIIVGLVEMERSEGIHAPAALRFLGEASYALYLVHFQVLSVVAALFHKLNFERYCPLVVLFFAAAALSVIVSLLFHRIIEVPLLAFINKTFGKPRTVAAAADLVASTHER